MDRLTRFRSSKLNLRHAGLALAPALLLTAPLLGQSLRPARATASVPSALQFEANQGQTDAQVRYVARGADSVVFLTADGAVIETAGSECATPTCRWRRPSDDRGVVRMQFAGASAATVSGIQPSATSTNVYTNGRRLTDVPTYSQVAYRGLYPGVDLLFYGHDGALEYDLQVAPGADPHRIALNFGATAPTLTAAGDLRFAVAGGPVYVHRPVAYQTEANRRRPVSARFTRRADGSYGIALGAYDRAHPLVIDPILTFATYLGGATYSSASSVAVDSSGLAYVTGTTLDTKFPTTSGAAHTTNAGDHDVFISKFAADGTSLAYSTYLGGSGDDEGAGIAVDSTGAAYVTGFTLSSDFPATNGSTANGGYDAFVAKLTPAGAISYAAYLGGSGDDKATSIAVDSSGDAVIAGYTSSTNFPTSTGAPQTSLKGKTNAFVASVNPTATALVYSTYLGGSSVDEANAIALDASANAYVAGFSSSSDFPVSAAPIQATNKGSDDAFVVKVDRSGKSIDYATYLGGSQDDKANGIAVDIAGDAYVTGYTNSINFPVTSTSYHPSSSGGTDVFVVELNPSGSAEVYGTYVGGSSQDIGSGIVVDSSGAAYVTGFTSSKDFPVTSNATQPTFGGNNDAFLFKLDPIGANLLFATYYGGSGLDEANSIGINPGQTLNAIYFTGFSNSGNFPTTSGVLQPAAPAATAAFLVKMITAPQAVFSPATLGFTAQALKVASASEAVTLTNGGEQTLTLTSITTTGPFSQTNTCGASLVPEATCTINVIFTPTANGATSGSIVIKDNSVSGTESMPLTGVGGSFTFSVAPTTTTITAGSSASYTLTVTPAAGFTDIINFTCTGAPTGATCTPSPTSLTMNGSAAALTTYTVTTNARTTALPPIGGGRNPWLLLGLLMALASLLWFGISRFWRLRTGTQPLWRAPFWAGAFLVAALGLAAAGCGGTASTSVGTPAGNYTLTFTGTDASTSSITQSVTVTLTVD